MTSLTVRPRLGRIAIGNQNSTHFRTAAICSSVLSNCSDEKKVELQRMMDSGSLFGGKQHRYQQVSRSRELQEGRKLRELRALNGVGGPCPDKRRILKLVIDRKQRGEMLEDLRQFKLLKKRAREQGAIS